MLLNSIPLWRMIHPQQYFPLPSHTGYIGSKSFLERVYELVLELKQNNNDITYGQRWTVPRSLRNDLFIVQNVHFTCLQCVILSWEIVDEWWVRENVDWWLVTENFYPSSNISVCSQRLVASVSRKIDASFRDANTKPVWSRVSPSLVPRPLCLF